MGSPGLPSAYVATILGLAITVLAKEWAPIDYTLLVTLFLFVAPGIITVRDALAGFSNDGVLTVAVLCAVAAGVQKTGVLARLFSKGLGSPSSLPSALWRLCVPVAVASSFLANTSVVAVMIPVVQNWCTSRGLDPRGLLMPLSFATILGGSNSLLGTSTNLVVSGQLRDYFNKHASTLSNPSDYTIKIFDIAPYGAAVCAGGLIVILSLAKTVLAPHEPVVRPAGPGGRGRSPGSSTGTFLYRAQVLSQSPAAGQTIQAAGLRGIGVLFVASVQRQGRVSIASPEFVLLTGDILELVGDPAEIPAFLQKHKLAPVVDEPGGYGGAGSSSSNGGPSGTYHPPGSDSLGLSLPAFQSDKEAADPLARLNLLVLRVKRGAPVCGWSIRDLCFRSNYNAAVVSFRRNGVEPIGPLGATILQENDELLVDADPNFFSHTASPVCDAFDVIDSPAARQATNLAVTMQVQPGAPLIGKTVLESKLRGLRSLFLVAVENAATGQVIDAVGPEYTFREGDLLFWAGDPNEVPKLRGIPGLAPYNGQLRPGQAQPHELLAAGPDRSLVHVVVAARSPLVGRRVKDSRFRSRFDAVILGITHNGERIKTKIGEMVLRARDVLLLEAGPTFLSRHRSDAAFSLVLPLQRLNWAQQPLWRGLVAIALIAAAVGVAALERQAVLTVMVFAVALLVLIGGFSVEDLRGAIAWEVVTALAAAFGISTAITESGLAEFLAQAIVSFSTNVTGGTGLFPILLVLYVLTAGLSKLIASNAAAALVFPVAIAVVQHMGLPAKVVMFGIMFAVADFMTPWGYLTNVMVYAAGGYSARDFVRFGGIVQAASAALALQVLSMHQSRWTLFSLYIGALAVFIFVVELIEVARAPLPRRKGRARSGSPGSGGAGGAAAPASTAKAQRQGGGLVPSRNGALYQPLIPVTVTAKPGKATAGPIAIGGGKVNGGSGTEGDSDSDSAV